MSESKEKKRRYNLRLEYICRFPRESVNDDELEQHCEGCGLNRLFALGP